MCTNSVLIYRETYRALRANASGRSNINPIQALKQMQTVIPFSVCGKIESAMMKALTSFNQRYLAPVGVHETRIYHMHLYQNVFVDDLSELRYFSPEHIHQLLLNARNRAYAHKAIHYTYRLQKQDRIAAHLRMMDGTFNRPAPFSQMHIALTGMKKNPLSDQPISA